MIMLQVVPVSLANWSVTPSVLGTTALTAALELSSSAVVRVTQGFAFQLSYPLLSNNSSAESPSAAQLESGVENAVCSPHRHDGSLPRIAGCKSECNRAP